MPLKFGIAMKRLVSVFAILSVLLAWAGVDKALASFIVHSRGEADIQVKGFDDLKSFILFEGHLAAGTEKRIDTEYQGLALLLFKNGPHYPLVLGDCSFTLRIESPDKLPSFTGSVENCLFYRLLTDTPPGPDRYDFPLLMIKAKELLETTRSIRTVDELTAMRDGFHRFVSVHYQDLRHSDMLMRFIAQSFMMLEYFDYHIPGSPATDIQVRYQQAVMDGVRNWLDVLKHNIPDHEILNYIVSLYYDRSMVTLAYKIIESFKEVALCPGEEKLTPAFSPTLNLTDANGKQKTLQELSGKKTFAFVSDDCPVSKVETVIKARHLARQGNEALIVVPLQPLSKIHLSILRMVSGGNIMFINDEKWRKENIQQRMKLPLFIQVE
jgi:hypothetical protein